MRWLLLTLLLMPALASAQTLIRSSVFGALDTVYTLRVWRWDWDEGLLFHAEHPFRVSTATYFLPGEYTIGYYMGDSLLHAENIHSGKQFEYINKVVMWRDLPMDSVSFVRKKEGALYLGY